MKIKFGGHDLVLHHAGLVLWPALQMAMVADLHLEKASHFARRGFFLPPYDSHKTLTLLLEVLAKEKIRQLLLLGDCFHDPQGFHRLNPADRALFIQLEKYDPLWIKGNHDKDFVPPGFTPHDTLALNGLIFRHQAENGTVHEISGHFHPKAEILHKGSHLSRRCFIEDGKKMILPAFGAYTGGLYITDPVINRHFDPDYRVYVPGLTKVYKITA